MKRNKFNRQGNYSFKASKIRRKIRNALKMFDSDNPDVELFNLVDGEISMLAGSKLYVHRYMQPDTSDDVYDEERGKVLYQKPMEMFGHFDPRV